MQQTKWNQICNMLIWIRITIIWAYEAVNYEPIKVNTALGETQVVQ